MNKIPKIIFTSRYLKDNKKIGGFVDYISTRDGVDISVNIKYKNAPSTKKQKEKIDELLKIAPDMKNSHEYKDYIENPTIINASELITETMSQNADLFYDKENFVEYMAMRPRVEKICEHGLFTQNDIPIDLEKVKKEIADHKGIVWTNVVSLKRDDADRLSYNNADTWKELVRSKQNIIAQGMKIDIKDLKWYAAFHNEGHHPHIHLIAYSKNPKREFLTNKGIEKMRSAFANEIFKQDLIQLYGEKSEVRDLLSAEANEKMSSLILDINNNYNSNPKLEEMLLNLKERLASHKGKKVYGYLKPNDKKLVDNILTELASDSRIQELYGTWCDLQNKIIGTYKTELLDHPPLWEQKEFKPIKNIIISEAEKLNAFETAIVMGEIDNDIPVILRANGSKNLPPTDIEIPNDTENLPDSPQESIPDDPTPDEETPEVSSKKLYIEWNKEYKQSQNYLYGRNRVEKDIEKAYKLFTIESEKGNVLATFDLGRMYMQGLLGDHSEEQAQEYFSKALNGFMSVSGNTEKMAEYINYRIGKMHNMGYGTEQNYESAAGWYRKAENNRFAQYSLAGLYYYGNGVEQDYTETLKLYESSAEQGNAYAMYETAKMYNFGQGTEIDKDTADYWYKEAFDAFMGMEKSNADDKLWYRLGQMLEKGLGTEVDIYKAKEFYIKSADAGNENAKYALAKLYLDDPDSEKKQIDTALLYLEALAENNDLAQYKLGKLYLQGNKYIPQDIQKAIHYSTISADSGNQYAQYQLGKIYLSEDGAVADIEKALFYLTQSAEQGNEYAQCTLAKYYLNNPDSTEEQINSSLSQIEALAENNDLAQYQLGKFYLQGNKHIPKDIQKAIHYLTISADNGNQYSQYQLGKLYLFGNETDRDREKAIFYLTKSAEQGNEYAQYLLEYKPPVNDSIITLLHHLSKIIEDECININGKHVRADSKEMKKILQKKSALGLKN